MVRYIEKLVIPKEVGDRVDYLLTHEPATEDECMGEDETTCYTRRFYGTNIEMDIKLCGVQFWEGTENTPWTEAVLFEDGCEVACTDVSYEYFGKWEIEYNGKIYVCNVVKGE